MTTLLQRRQALEAKLRDLALAKRHATHHKLIQQRTQEWRDSNDRLKELRIQASCLTLESQDAQMVSSKRAAMRHNARTILTRLQNHEDVDELTRDAAWKRLLKSAETLTENLESSGRKAWTVYIEEQGALENPATLRQRTPRMPQNDEALQAYQASYAAYEAIARLSLPRTADDLAQVANHVAACRLAFSKLTFDLPSDVKRFYEAVNAGTATLEHITPLVLKWLAEHQHLQKFRVRSSGQ